MDVRWQNLTIRDKNSGAQSKQKQVYLLEHYPIEFNTLQ
jgi:hypothetical protein